MQINAQLHNVHLGLPFIIVCVLVVNVLSLYSMFFLCIPNIANWKKKQFTIIRLAQLKPVLQYVLGVPLKEFSALKHSFLHTLADRI